MAFFKNGRRIVTSTWKVTTCSVFHHGSDLLDSTVELPSGKLTILYVDIQCLFCHSEWVILWLLRDYEDYELPSDNSGLSIYPKDTQGFVGRGIVHRKSLFFTVPSPSLPWWVLNLRKKSQTPLWPTSLHSDDWDYYWKPAFFFLTIFLQCDLELSFMKN